MPSTSSPAKPQSRLAARLPRPMPGSWPFFYLRESHRDLAGDEVPASERQLVIEENPADSEEAKGFSIVDGQPSAQKAWRPHRGFAAGTDKVSVRPLVWSPRLPNISDVDA